MNIKDLSEDIIFNNGFSIEPEIAAAHWKELEKEHPKLVAHNETSYIKEIDNLHKIDKKERLIIFNKIKETYRDKFPRGTSRYTSGGVHLHLFINPKPDKDEVRNAFIKLNNNRLNNNLMNSMLFMKTANNKFYHREAGRSALDYMSGVEGSKGGATTFQVGYQTIEFRCNNIFDERIYGYYVGIFMLSYFGISLSKIPFTPSDEKRIIRGEEYQVPGTSESKDINFIEFDKLEGIEITDAYRDIFISNVNKILSVLRTIGHTTSHDALMYYLKEYVPQYEFTSKVIDMATGDYINEGDEIKVVQLEGMRFVFKNTKIITRKVGAFISQPDPITRIEDVITLVPVVKTAILKYKEDLHA